MSTSFTIDTGAGTLSGEEAGEGSPVVLLHGLTATRRYVVMGSKTLERSGHRVVQYDARGHGRSSPAGAYTYEHLASDLEAVLEDRGIERAVLAGASMGAHTIVRFAVDHPERVAAVALITPAHEPGANRNLDRWDALARGLRTAGVEGFIAAYGIEQQAEAYQATIRKVLEQRLALHEHLEAVADALEQVPRSEPFDGWEELGRLRAPAVIVGSNDAADPGHPLAVAERWADEIPDSELLTEEPGKSPLAWQGSQLSRVIAELAGRV